MGPETQKMCEMSLTMHASMTGAANPLLGATNEWALLSASVAIISFAPSSVAMGDGPTADGFSQISHLSRTSLADVVRRRAVWMLMTLNPDSVDTC